MRIVLIYIALLCSISSIRSQCDRDTFNVWNESWVSCSASTNPISDTIINHWVLVDFKQPYAFDSIHIWNYNLDSTGYDAKQISVYGSLDSINWRYIGSRNLDIAHGDSTYQGESFTLDTVVPSRFLVLSIDSTVNDSCVGLSEAAFYFSEEACVQIQPRIETSYNVCSKDYTIAFLDSSSYDQWYWEDYSTLVSRSGLIADTYELTVGDSLCLFTYPIVLPTIDTQINSWGIGSSIPDGEYASMDSIVTSGIVDDKNNVVLITENNTGLTQHFNVDQGGELSIYANDCQDSTLLLPVTVANVEADYLKNRHNDFIGLGKLLNVTTSSSDSTSAHELLTGNTTFTKVDAYRFLAQATFGATPEMVNTASEMGYEEWIDWQTSIPSKSYFDDLFFVMRFGQSAILYHTNFLRSWWHNTLSGEEYLRDRMAFALSQIFVISSKSFLHNFGDGFTDYYDVLSSHAFGNYKDLLYDVTMHPMMGFYLSHLNNPATDSTQNRYPDENYAREVLQLFSIGLYELNNDGTQKLDSLGNAIPTYDNDDIIQYAKIFTGLKGANRGFGAKTSLTPNRFSRSFMTRPMEVDTAYHEPGLKVLLNTDTIQNGLSAVEDIVRAIDNIFNHPNVGPFIATRLIQRFVKSAPTPAYVDRVASVFNDDGQGVRGNLKAVIKAILLDDEARSCDWTAHPEHGKLKEPLLRFTQLYKAFRLNSSTETFYSVGESHGVAMQQEPLRSPSVFNFYTPDYTPPGILSDNDIPAPEFQIFNSSSSIGYVNNLDSLSFHDVTLDLFEGVLSLNFDEELALVNDPVALINHLDTKLTFGSLTERNKLIIIDAINNYIGSTNEEKIKLAIYLISLSPEFAILK